MSSPSPAASNVSLAAIAAIVASLGFLPGCVSRRASWGEARAPVIDSTTVTLDFTCNQLGGYRPVTFSTRASDARIQVDVVEMRKLLHGIEPLPWAEAQGPRGIREAADTCVLLMEERSRAGVPEFRYVFLDSASGVPLLRGLEEGLRGNPEAAEALTIREMWFGVVDDDLRGRLNALRRARTVR